MIKKHESLLSFINIIRSISLTAITASSTYAFIVVILFFFFFLQIWCRCYLYR